MWHLSIPRLGWWANLRQNHYIHIIVSGVRTMASCKCLLKPIHTHIISDHFRFCCEWCKLVNAPNFIGEPALTLLAILLAWWPQESPRDLSGVQRLRSSWCATGGEREGSCHVESGGDVSTWQRAYWGHIEGFGTSTLSIISIPIPMVPSWSQSLLWKFLGYGLTWCGGLSTFSGDSGGVWIHMNVTRIQMLGKWDAFVCWVYHITYPLESHW